MGFRIIFLFFLCALLAGCGRAETPVDVPETPPGSSEDAGTGDSGAAGGTDASSPAAVPPDSASEEEDPDGVFTVNKITYELQEKWKIKIDTYDFKVYLPEDIYGPYTELCIDFKMGSGTGTSVAGQAIDEGGQDLSGIPPGEALATELAGFAAAEGVSVLSTEETTVLNCPGLVVSGKKLREKLDDVSHDPTVYWGRAIYFVRDGGVYSFSFWTPSEMLAEDYAAELSEAVEYAYENPNAYAEQEADRETMRAYTVNNASYELPKVWKLVDDRENFKGYDSKTDISASFLVSYITDFGGQDLTASSPESALDTVKNSPQIAEVFPGSAFESRKVDGCPCLVLRCEPMNFEEDSMYYYRFYLAKDAGIYIFGVSATAKGQYEELEELVENARFD